MKLITLFLFCNSLFALPLDHSFTCSNRDLFQYRGVNCCETRVDRDQCRESVDKLLPLNVIQKMDEVVLSIMNGEVFVPEVPNCHFTAVHFNFPKLLFTKKLVDDIYSNILDSHYELIDAEDSKYGDLILFYLTAKERVYDFETLKGSFKKIEGMAHSGTYLGNGLVFQKESNLTLIYSIDTVEGTRRAYEIFMNTPKLSSVRITLKYYRPLW